MIDLLILEKAIGTIKTILTLAVFINLGLLMLYITTGNKPLNKL